MFSAMSARESGSDLDTGSSVSAPPRLVIKHNAFSFLFMDTRQHATVILLVTLLAIVPFGISVGSAQLRTGGSGGRQIEIHPQLRSGALLVGAEGDLIHLLGIALGVFVLFVIDHSVDVNHLRE